jgi:peptidoglycan/LPS O-acetylase OafA/YrhL
VERIRSLDGVRGIAVLCVVIFHFFPRSGAGMLWPLASTGWIGVDLFFVLSGYLITSVLLKYRGGANYYRNFYLRRALRLLPLYYSLFLGVLVLTPLLRIHWRFGHLVMLLHGANLVLPTDSSLGMLGPFNFFHVWSLSVEEQFYLLWPWLVGSRLSHEALRRVCLAGIMIAPMLRLVLQYEHVNAWWIYQSLPTRMDSLLAGALLALIPLPSLKSARVVGASALVVYAGLAGFGHSLFFLSGPIQGFGYSALALFFASVLVMGLHVGSVMHQVCSHRLLCFYGKYSYGMYLWHYLFSRQFGWLETWVQRLIPFSFVASATSFALVLLCSTLMAVVSYRVIERPFLKLKSRVEYGATRRNEDASDRETVAA